MFQSFDLPSLFTESLNVVIIDNEEVVRSEIETVCRDLKLFNVIAMAKNKRPVFRIPDTTFIHACVTELDRYDVTNKEYNYIKKLIEQTVTIIFTAYASAELGARCKMLGVADVLDKPVTQSDKEKREEKLSELVVSLFHAALMGLFIRDRKIFKGTAGVHALEILINNVPTEISQWASLLSISKTRLRDICNNYFHASPKYILFINLLYHRCFYEYLEDMGFEVYLKNKKRIRYDEKEMEKKFYMYREKIRDYVYKRKAIV